MKSANITVIHENYLNILIGFFHLSRKNLFQNTHPSGGKKPEWKITQTKPSRQEDSPKAVFQGSHWGPCLQRNPVQVQQCPVWLPGTAHLHQPQTHLRNKELLLGLMQVTEHSHNLLSQRMGQAIHCQQWIWRWEVKTHWQGELLSYTTLLSVTLHYFNLLKL